MAVVIAVSRVLIAPEASVLKSMVEIFRPVEAELISENVSVLVLPESKPVCTSTDVVVPSTADNNDHKYDQIINRLEA